jgi:hypothetical protein
LAQEVQVEQGIPRIHDEEAIAQLLRIAPVRAIAETPLMDCCI